MAAIELRRTGEPAPKDRATQLDADAGEPERHIADSQGGLSWSSCGSRFAAIFSKRSANSNKSQRTSYERTCRANCRSFAAVSRNS
jgi:hypothetical protein